MTLIRMNSSDGKKHSNCGSNMFVKEKSPEGSVSELNQNSDKPMDLSMGSKSADSSFNEEDTNEIVTKTEQVETAASVTPKTPVTLIINNLEITPPSPPNKRKYDDISSELYTPNIKSNLSNEVLYSLSKKAKLSQSTFEQQGPKLQSVPKINVKSFSQTHSSALNSQNDDVTSNHFKVLEYIKEIQSKCQPTTCPPSQQHDNIERIQQIESWKEYFQAQARQSINQPETLGNFSSSSGNNLIPRIIPPQQDDYAMWLKNMNEAFNISQEHNKIEQHEKLLQFVSLMTAKNMQESAPRSIEHSPPIMPLYFPNHSYTPTFPLLSNNQFFPPQTVLNMQLVSQAINQYYNQTPRKAPEESSPQNVISQQKRPNVIRSFSLDDTLDSKGSGNSKVDICSNIASPMIPSRSTYSVPNLSSNVEEHSFNTFDLHQKFLHEMAQRQSECKQNIRSIKSPTKNVNMINIQNFNNYHDLHSRQLAQMSIPNSLLNIKGLSQQSSEANGNNANESDDEEGKDNDVLTVRKKSGRALTGRHVRSGTGASLLTLKTLREKINGKQNQESVGTPTTSRSGGKRGRRKQLNNLYPANK